MISVRMRAELEGKHISGAERLVEEKNLESVIRELLKRPKVYDRMVITVESVEEIQLIPRALSIYSYDFRSVEEAREFAVEKLREVGVREELSRKAIELLSKGANPKGGNMRGAVLMDVESGGRLEPDQERGIRTVRVDWKDRNSIKLSLLKRGIKRKYLNRLMDALALATKNAHCGVLAELCWSDDEDYVTGYVASKSLGYVRIAPMKEFGNPIGGRVYFVSRNLLNKLIECLEKKAILIENL
ncbi:6-carboxyhexanoate--CoA ligase [Thermocrinis sp.]